MSAGRELPYRDRDREVPRRDEADHPERTAEREQPLVGDGRLVHLTDRPVRLTRRVAEDRRGAQRFEPCLAQRLPHLRRHVLRDLLGARLDRRGRFREVDRALPSRQRRPRGERLARSLDRGTRVLGRRGRIHPRHLRRPPWAPLLVRLPGRALAPFAADVVAGGRSGHRLGHGTGSFSISSEARTTGLTSVPISGTWISTK